jgi:hypothetical protein
MSPRVDLPLFKKGELIKDSDRYLSERDLAIKYKISTGAVCNILKRKQEYLDDFESNQCHEVRRKIKNNLGKKLIKKLIHGLLLKEQKIYLYQVQSFKKEHDKLLQNLVVMLFSRLSTAGLKNSSSDIIFLIVQFVENQQV